MLLARRGGWEGLELRSAPGEPVHVGLTGPERAVIRRLLSESGVTVLAVASYVEIDDPQAHDSEVVARVLEHVSLAGDLGASFVRVFPGGPSADGAALRRLRALSTQLHDDTVGVALETHDSCSRGDRMAELLDRVGDPRIRAVWDVQHPWRAGEAVADTVRSLAPHLGYVQITDARSATDTTPCLLGTGALPLREAYEELRRAGYEGWVSLEWASYWHPEAPPLATALEGARHWLSGSLWDATSVGI